MAGRALGPLLKEGAEELLTSGEGNALKTDAGKWVVDTLKSYSGAVKQDAQSLYKSMMQYIPNPTPADHAFEMKAALDQSASMNDKLHFGANREKLSQAIALAKADPKGGIVHATQLGDMVSTALREERPKTFTDKSAITTTNKSGVTNWRTMAGIKSTSPYQAPQEGERAIKDFLAKSYLGRVAIPHLAQNLNVAVTLGFRSWQQAMDEVISNPKAARAFTESTGALFEEQYRNMMDIVQGKDTIWHKLIHMPLFSKERQMFITHAAVAGKYAGIEAGEEFAATQSKRAAMRLEFLRLDPAKILRQGGKLTQEDMQTAGYASADENMYIDRDIKTPAAWDQNRWSRSMFLYKAFQFRTGKLLKDAVVRGFRGGKLEGFKTLATIGTVFPIAGHIIGDLENLATGRKPEDRSTIFRPTEMVFGKNAITQFSDERIDDLGHMAAFGIWYSLFRAAVKHRMTDYTTGPLFSLLSDVANAAVELPKGNVKSSLKSVTRRVPVVGPGIAAHIDDIEDWVKN